ncbi:MAG: aldose epimerase family protein [Candidatus Limnocylindrales bacterium]
MTGQTSDAGRLVLHAADATLEVSPLDGGRISSLVVHGSELLRSRAEGGGPILWGSFPMAPFAGRIRHARFQFAGRDVQLEVNHPPNAIHGTVFQRGWHVDDPTTLSIDLGPGWPFPGRLVQRFALRDDGLDISLTLLADEPMPAWMGWHPWFRRRLTGTDGRPAAPSEPVQIHLDAAWMYVRDADGLPTGELVAPPPGPWDDCFTGLRSSPRLTWPGVLGLELTSSADHWVVYDEPPDAVCVEPQTAPPDFVNLAPSTTLPGVPLVATMGWRWWALD